MTTSLLYHCFGIRGYQFKKTQYVSGEVHFYIEQHRRNYRCSVCNQKESLIRRGSVARKWRSIPIGSKAAFIHLKIAKVYCPHCDCVRQVRVPFAAPKKSYTNAFERLVCDLLKKMTINDVALFLKVSWDIVKDIDKTNLKRRFDKPVLKDLRLIAIDEISVGKHHQYLTLVLDLERGQVVYVGEGKGSNALDDFFKRIRRSKPPIKAVSIDLSPAYKKAVEENLPKARLIFDKFHIIKLFNETLDQIRRDVQNRATEEEKKVLKGKRWVLLRNTETVRASEKYREQLQEALSLNEPLAMAYYLKEQLEKMWSQKDWFKAYNYMVEWSKQAFASSIPQLQKFAKTLMKHAAGIMNYYEFQITSAKIEGFNNKVKTLNKRSYGFRDKEYYKLKIKSLHTQKIALSG